MDFQPYHQPRLIRRSNTLRTKKVVPLKGKMNVIKERNDHESIQIRDLIPLRILCLEEANLIGIAISQVILRNNYTILPVSSIIITSSITIPSKSRETNSSSSDSQSSTSNSSKISKTHTILIACFLTFGLLTILSFILFWSIGIRKRRKIQDKDDINSIIDLDLEKETPVSLAAVDLPLSDEFEKKRNSTLISLPTTTTATKNRDSILLPPSKESTRTIRAILQDSIPTYLPQESTPNDDSDNHLDSNSNSNSDSHSILSIERPKSPVLAALLRAYQEAQDLNESDSLRSIPMSQNLRTITLRDPILLINPPLINLPPPPSPVLNITSKTSSFHKSMNSTSKSIRSFNTACSRLEEEEDGNVEIDSFTTTTTSDGKLDTPSNLSDNNNLEIPIVNMSKVNDSQPEDESDQDLPTDVDEKTEFEVEDSEGMDKKLRRMSKQTVGVRSEAFINARAKFQEE